MNETVEEYNKARLIAGFDVLFNQRDFQTAKQYWSPSYVQHSSQIAPGREGLFDLVRSLPSDTRYEHGLILAERNYVMAHGRYRGNEGPSLIVVDVMRIEKGMFEEHWDVIQEEATRARSKSGLPMFGESFTT